MSHRKFTAEFERSKHSSSSSASARPESLPCNASRTESPSSVPTLSRRKFHEGQLLRSTNHYQASLVVVSLRHFVHQLPLGSFEQPRVVYAPHQQTSGRKRVRFRLKLTLIPQDHRPGSDSQLALNRSQPDSDIFCSGVSSSNDKKQPENKAKRLPSLHKAKYGRVVLTPMGFCGPISYLGRCFPFWKCFKNGFILCYYLGQINRPFYRSGGHVELIRFKEYYRMPWGQEHISFVFSSAFREIFCQWFPQNKIVISKKILVPCLDLTIIAFFAEKYTVTDHISNT